MTRRTWLMLVFTAAVWGSSYMFIKVALDDFSEGAIVCLRTALGAALLLSFAAHRGVLADLRGRVKWMAIIACVQVIGPFLLITYGETRISSSLTAILISVVPIFTALLALRFDDAERSHGWALVGIGIGIVGVALLFGLDLSGSGDELIGGAMMLTAALGYAISWMRVKHKLAGAAPEAVAGGTMVVAAIATAPLLLAAPPSGAPGFDSIASMLALGAGGTGVAFVLYYTLIADVGPARASMGGYVAPGFSIVYGVVLLGESLTLAAVAGLVLILAGSWLGAQGRLPRFLRRSAPSRAPPPEATLPVRTRPLLRRVDERQALERGAKQPRDEPQPGVFGAQVEQPLLGLAAEVDGRRHLVGAHRDELGRLERAVGRLLDELGVRLVRGVGAARVGRLLLVDQELDRAGRVREVVLPVDDAERARAAREY